MAIGISDDVHPGAGAQGLQRDGEILVLAVQVDIACAEEIPRFSVGSRDVLPEKSQSLPLIILGLDRRGQAAANDQERDQGPLPQIAIFH